MPNYLFLLFFLCFGNVTTPQETAIQKTQKEVKYDRDSVQQSLDFDDKKLSEYKEDNAFNYVEIEEEENLWTRFVRWIGNLWDRFWRWVFNGVEPGPFWGFIVRVLPYLIAAAIVIFIVWLFYKLNPGATLFGKKPQPEVFFTEEEEIIKTKNIQKLIDKAVRNKNYRLAVRYHYLLILKKLSEGEHIDYEFDKTNNDYISEITSENIRFPFSKATNIYDYIWYGSFDVVETDYHKARNTFMNLEKSMNKQ